MDRIEDHVPRLADRAELQERPEGLEAVVAGQRRVRLSPEAAWLVAQLDGRLTVEGIAARLEQRLGQAVTPLQAHDLLDRTLVTHGIATFAASKGRTTAARLRVLTMHPAREVASVAARLRFLAHPLLMLTAAISSAVALGAAAASAQASDWRTPLGWALALPLAALSLWAHEWMHGIAFARGGGIPGAITFTRGWGFRMSTELPYAQTLSRPARILVDIAGVYAQWVVAGIVAAIALTLGAGVPMPALAITVVLALLNLTPRSGSDGAWLVQDLFGRDLGDRIVRVPQWGRLLGLVKGWN